MRNWSLYLASIISLALTLFAPIQLWRKYHWGVLQWNGIDFSISDFIGVAISIGGICSLLFAFFIKNAKDKLIQNNESQISTLISVVEKKCFENATRRTLLEMTECAKKFREHIANILTSVELIQLPLAAEAKARLGKVDEHFTLLTRDTRDITDSSEIFDSQVFMIQRTGESFWAIHVCSDFDKFSMWLNSKKRSFAKLVFAYKNHLPQQCDARRIFYFKNSFLKSIENEAEKFCRNIKGKKRTDVHRIIEQLGVPFQVDGIQSKLRETYDRSAKSLTKMVVNNMIVEGYKDALREAQRHIAFEVNFLDEESLTKHHSEFYELEDISIRDSEEICSVSYEGLNLQHAHFSLRPEEVKGKKDMFGILWNTCNM